VQEYSKIDEVPRPCLPRSLQREALLTLSIARARVDLADGREITIAPVDELGEIPLRADGSVAYAV